jgi:hypothetical protein
VPTTPKFARRGWLAARHREQLDHEVNEASYVSFAGHYGVIFTR